MSRIAGGMRQCAKPATMTDWCNHGDPSDFTARAAAYLGLPYNGAVLAYFTMIESFAADLAAFPLEIAVGSAPEFEPSKAH